MGVIMFAIFMAASLLSGRVMAEAAAITSPQPDFWQLLLSMYLPVIPVVIILLLLLYTKKGQTIIAASLLVGLDWLKTDQKNPKQ